MARAPKANFGEATERLNKYKKAWRNRAKAVKAGITPPPYDRLNSVLKRNVYSLVRYCLKEPGLLETMQKSVLPQGRSTAKVEPLPQKDENPFYWALPAVARNLSPSNRSRFAHELHYALLHEVPTRFLIGFIYQIGTSKDLRTKILEGKRERWFKKKGSEADADD